MSKLLLTAAGGAVLTGAAVYYVSPALQPDLDVPPVLVDGTPAEVRQRLQRETYAALTSGSRRAELAGLAEVTPKWNEENRGQATFRLLGDNLMKLEFQLEASGSNRTAIDVKVSFPDSAFSRSKELHPYDLKAAAATADLLATEYLGSVFEGRKMARGKELMPLFTQTTGFDKEETKAWAKRVEAALRGAYGDRLKSYAASFGSDYWGDYGQFESERFEYEEGRAAREAEREAERAMREASAPMDDGSGYSDW